MSTTSPRRRASRAVGLAVRLARTGVAAVVLVACVVSSVPVRGEEIIDRMLAVVAGDLIMLSDVAAAIEFGLVPQTTGPDAVRVALSQLIDRSLMLAEVDRYAPPEPSGPEVDRELASARARFASVESYRAALDRYGIDEQSLRQTLRANLRLRGYLTQRFTSVPPSDDELAEYLRRHAERFRRDGGVPPLEAVRAEIVQAWMAERRQSLLDEWIASLRRRATITDIYAETVERAPSGGRASRPMR